VERGAAQAIAEMKDDGTNWKQESLLLGQQCGTSCAQYECMARLYVYVTGFDVALSV
jgi:hypothetical protein